eukprot:scaffold22560_cov135-Cylindrotheca_fusiformis.AAC.57
MNPETTPDIVKKPEVGSKRPLSRTGKNGEPLSEKKLRRLEKNRLSARECRRRKREATENVQRQINLLEGENLRLRLQLQERTSDLILFFLVDTNQKIGEEAEAKNQVEQQKLTESLDSLLKSGASESEIYATIEEYKEKFADYGRDRRSAIEFHLRNVERLLMPTQTTSLLMTTLQMSHANTALPSKQEAQSQQEVSSSAPPTDVKSLFSHLVKMLEVTQDQAAALKDSRFVAQEMDECLKKSLGVLGELRSRLTQCGEDLESEFNTIRTILTPTQAAKFLVWVANNKACMHMLNELWNKVYPQDGDVEAGEVTP